MGISLATGANYVKKLNASFLNGMTSFSWGVWCSVATINGSLKNYVWSHKGPGGQISLRKESTSNKWRFSVTVPGGVFVTKDSSAAVTANTLYYVSGTWRMNVASTGVELYINGALEAASSTTTQTVPYDSQDATTPLILGSQNESPTYNELGGNIEGFWIAPGYYMDAIGHEAMYRHMQPELAGFQPGAYYRLDGDNPTQIGDWSGNSRHIDGFVGTAGNAGPMGRYDQHALQGGELRKIAASAPAVPMPSDWTIAGIANHPSTTIVAGSLDVTKVYEFRVYARRTVNGTVIASAPSAAIQVQPSNVQIRHVPKRVFIG